LFRAIYKELVEINTTASRGDTVKAAEAMARRLIDGGLPAMDVMVLSSAPRKGNLVARLRGTGKLKPLLLVAHIDVVEAKREDWAFDPFKLQEVDGYFRGRGTVDDKGMAAIFIANLIRYRREGLRPDRDLILALTTDEELAASEHNGMRWLLDKHRGLVRAELALNEGGGGIMRAGKKVSLSLQLAEKVYLSFRMEVKDRGGHSAQPRADTAINRLAAGLLKLRDFDFPPRLNPVTSAYLAAATRFDKPDVRAAVRALEEGKASATQIARLSGRYNSLIRTTCVATLLEAGHAENALPQTARATVNCRLLPDEQPALVEATLNKVMADPKISVVPLGTVVESPVFPLSTAVVRTVEAVAGELWPGVPVIPTQSSGYTDSRWLRRAGIPTYGVSGLFTEQGKSGVHGLNEQVRVEDLFAAKAFLYRLVKRLASTELDGAGQK
jgi:acetylornithine deacetylase/succinyl-diaminopimelate desuccinylase-like protein